MRYTKILLTVSYLLLIHFTTSAQAAWQWGIKNSGKGGMNSRPAAIDASGNLYVAGSTWGSAYTIDSMTFGSHKVYSNGKYDQLIITKTDSSGNYLWAVGSQNTSANTTALALDQSGNIFVTGFYGDTSIKLGTIVLTNPAPALPMSFIEKISSAGTVLWAQNVIQVNCGNSSSPIDMGLAVDGAGNVYVTENFYQNQLLIGATLLNNKGTPSITGDVLLLKYSTTGTLKWAKSYGGNFEDYPFVQDGGWFGADYDNSILTVTPNGHIYIAGTFYSDSIKFGNTTLYNPNGSWNTPGPTHNYLSKWDSSGNIIWVKYIEKKTSVNEIISNAREEVFITGALDSPDHWGGYALEPGALIAKLDSAGDLIWVRTDKGGDGRSVGIDPFGNVFEAGQFEDSINFNAHTLMAPTGNGSKIYIAQYDTSGNYLNSVAVADGAIGSISVRPDRSGHYYLVGNQFDIKLVFGPDVLDTTNIQGVTTFIAKYKYNIANSVHDPALVNDILIYPNPASNMLNIAATKKMQDLYITDVLGRKIYSASCNDRWMQINISNIPAGIYLITIDNTIVRKFVKD